MTSLKCLIIFFFACGTLLSPLKAQPQVDRKFDGVEVKKRVAPAVVKIETGGAFGTGFFIRPEGWILTNYHVIKDAPIDLVARAPFVRVTYGLPTEDGSIRAQDAASLWASVYRVDRRSDLALLLVHSLPQGMKTVPFVRLAAQTPAEGETCFAIGMPLAGMKWDLRDGILSSQGLYPDDVVTSLDTKIQPSDQRRRQLQRALAPEGSLRMIITTCGINPGDSGGPILNQAGELIAVTKAIPKSTQEGISFDKFSYHIHLEEIRKFIEDLPVRPNVLPPYSMPKTPQVTTLQSKKTNALIYEFSDVEDNKVATYIDIDQSSSNLTDSQKQTIFGESEADCWRKLGIEWAILKDANKPTVHFFDLDQNGEFETVYQNAMDDGDQPRLYARDDDGWRLEVCERDFLSTLKFHAPNLHLKFESLRKELPPLYTK
ncbi:MAG: trypsin-like peptidase domain-containing protein [Planctomycetaceae bacterium]|nr:trypsin-like peptidase domain-containing protein [Planctomycetaceae bacterium]